MWKVHFKQVLMSLSIEQGQPAIHNQCFWESGQAFAEISPSKETLAPHRARALFIKPHTVIWSEHFYFIRGIIRPIFTKNHLFFSQ